MLGQYDIRFRKGLCAELGCSDDELSRLIASDNRFEPEPDSSRLFGKDYWSQTHVELHSQIAEKFFFCELRGTAYRTLHERIVAINQAAACAVELDEELARWTVWTDCNGYVIRLSMIRRHQGRIPSTFTVTSGL